jgi:hypothetical protein
MALLIALVPVAAAVAHGPGHQPGYVSTVLAVRPLVPGLTATVLGGDQLLSVRNWSNRTVVVLGADGSPAYRLDTAGVSRRVGADWRLVKRGTSVTWHDPRIHWRSADPPAVVARAPDQAHRIASWRIPATVDGKRVVIYGSLGWVPDPTASAAGGGGGTDTRGALAVVLVLGGVVAASVVALAATRRRTRTS